MSNGPTRAETFHHRRSSRPSRILRPATFISPTTGERVRRGFSLRDASTLLRGGEATDETQPLLPGANNSANHHQRRRGFPHRALGLVADACRNVKDFALSKTGQNVFKCSIAYLLGTLATFVPQISRHLGRQDSKHMVATVTVWFHPARTMGSMHQGTIFGGLGFCYAAFVSFTSMAISMLFGNLDLLVVGHVIVLVVFCGGGLGAIAWLKQRMGHPLVNVACSLASLGCITVLVKEGAVQAGEFSENTVLGVLLMVLTGMVITTVVNMVVFPKRARIDLCKDLTNNTDLLGDLLILVTRAFLIGQQSDLEDDTFKRLSSDHQSSLNSMKKNLSEAKYEHFVLGTERQYFLEKRLVQCLTRLSQDIGGLRSAAFSQFTLLNEPSPAPFSLKSRTSSWTPMLGRSSNSVDPNTNTLDVITEAPEESEDLESDTQTAASKRSSRRASQEIDHGDLFATFLDQLGPPAKSLVYTLKQVLDVLPFEDDKPPKIAVTDPYISSLKTAIELYKETRMVALEELYKSRAFHATQSIERLADLEEVTASCGHFSFALMDFAEDVLEYLRVLEALKEETEQKPRSRSWTWLNPWQKRVESPKETLQPVSPIHEHTEDTAINHAVPEPIKRADDFADQHNYDGANAWTYRIWSRLRIFRREDVRFAIKVGIGAALYALPAFIDSTRPFFSHWRGEWGLVSYMVVCSMTIGASNTTGANRFIGTFVGGCLAIVAWLISNNNGDVNPWLLGFFGWMVSFGCFYIILVKGNGPMGRFILLTFNLGALYSYSLSVKDGDDDDDEGGIDPAIWDIVLHRVTSVIVGCIWAFIITRLIWPISARKKLSHGICILWLRMSLIWKRDPLAMFLLGTPKSTYMDIREEAGLQSFLAYLRSLRAAACSEFELKGPFPDKVIGRVLERTGRMLDAFHALNVVISKDMACTPGEAAVLRFTRNERIALSSRISHLFSVLASSMKLEYPLNDVLPSIEHSRDRLLARLYEFRRQEDGKGDGVAEQDYELLYAYTLVTGQLSLDIKAVSAEIETLYGRLDEENFKLQ
ncbi:hypothetical protein K431DRAFT_286095 [Polychaeton citri CBS 116435]|uniref:Integral membrane bound transporter domain-containing protein n=1 Tax=Polychaeton citri CBS 116435 TaxID=1314669 RepID=A0A9P4Q3U7_9PEZI|nr:hypothetical protein K431DRAFT_286095 [Polychaeton citri CBS 116435]